MVLHYSFLVGDGGGKFGKFRETWTKKKTRNLNCRKIILNMESSSICDDDRAILEFFPPALDCSVYEPCVPL